MGSHFYLFLFFCSHFYLVLLFGPTFIWSFLLLLLFGPLFWSYFYLVLLFCSNFCFLPVICHYWEEEGHLEVEMEPIRKAEHGQQHSTPISFAPIYICSNLYLLPFIFAAIYICSHLYLLPFIFAAVLFAPFFAPISICSHLYLLPFICCHFIFSYLPPFLPAPNFIQFNFSFSI